MIPTGIGIDRAPELIARGMGVKLRAPCSDDIARRAALGRNSEIARGFGQSLSQDEPMAPQDAAVELARRYGPGPHWVIADQQDDFIGLVNLAPVDTTNRSARLGIGVLDPERLGQGLGVAAIQLALTWGFDHLALHRVSLTVLADNPRAVAAYTRCGFVVEGRFRDTLLRDGAWYDDFAMAVLKPQWDEWRVAAHVAASA